MARRVAGGEQGQLGRAGPYPRLGRILRRSLLQGWSRAPATVRDRRGRRREGQGVAAPPVPLRDRHAELGPPRRPRYGPRLLSPRRRGGPQAGLQYGAGSHVRALGRLRGRWRHGRPHLRLVYTGRGAILWLPDIGRWAEVVADLLKPGGFLYLTEFHPLTDVFGDEDLSVEHDYFQDENPRVWDELGTYADFDAETTNNITYEWNHTLGKVVSAVISAGLNVELLHEFDYTMFPRWPFLEKSGFDTYRLPQGTPQIPLMYSLRARKPTG